MSDIRKYIKLIESVSNLPEKFYHGSWNKLEVGTKLTPRPSYEDDWGNTDFYEILERYRPNNMLPHKSAVFMVGDDNDIDLVGGGTEWVFEVTPIGKVERHDMNWSSQISMLISDGYNIESDEVKHAALAYWNGIPHEDEPVWEYLTPAAIIDNVYEF